MWSPAVSLRMRVPPKTEMQRRVYQEKLEMLRAYAVEQDAPLHGWDEIVEYLAVELGVLTGFRVPPVKATIQTWNKKRGFPLHYISARAGVMTTKLMVLAWLWHYRDGYVKWGKLPKQPPRAQEPQA